MKILSLGTYPIKMPFHGGQRRVSALCRQHRAAGHQITYVAAYPAGAYGESLTETCDYAVSAPDELGGGWASDVVAGPYCAENEEAYRHFSTIFNATEPDIISLESPFLYALAKKLQDDAGRPVKLIYSSQNVEAPLKREVLNATGLDAKSVGRIVSAVESVEREAVERADLVIAVSESDAAVYRTWAPKKHVIVRANGIDAPHAPVFERPEYFPEPYVVFVGSAHIPNRDGFMNLIVGDGLQFLPPEKAIAVIGNVSDLIYQHPVFQRRVTSNCDRVQFYPNASDEALATLLQHSNAVLLPISTGGGTNLKTAEALVAGKWVIGTPQSFRGYEVFQHDPNVIIAATRDEFVEGIRKALANPPPALSQLQEDQRAALLWPRVLEGLDVNAELSSAG